MKTRHIAALVIALMTGLVAALLYAQPATAHKIGQPSFLRINDSFVDYYPVRQPSTNVVDVPQSTDVNRHVPGEEISFRIDKKLLGVSHDNVDQMKFVWDFGDGGPAEGSYVTHSYSDPGSFNLKIYAEISGKQQLIESSALYILPDSGFQRARVYITVNGREVRNDSEEVKVQSGEEVLLEARLALGSTSGKVAEYVWDLGDGRTATGQSVVHTYDASHKQAYPMVRAVVDDRYFTDNSAWLSYPDAAAGVDIASWYDGAKRWLDSSLSKVFAGGGINYPLAILVLLFAVVAGALHSLTPGHGKAVLAALLVGRRHNKYRDLALLTASITIAHTAVIYVIGFLFLVLQSSRSVNSLIPVFETISACLVFVLALYLLWTGVRRWQKSRTQLHDHVHDRDHEHDHAHHHAKDAAAARQKGDTWSLIVAGAGGGIVPCLDALSLMLLAAGLGHAGFGLVLVLFFSLGLAGTITGIGLLLLAGKRRLLLSDKAEQNVYLYAPLVSGGIILVLAVLLLV